MNPWLKYSSLGLEIAVTLAIFVFVGVKVDGVVSLKFPLFTLLGTALGFTAIVVRIMKASKK